MSLTDADVKKVARLARIKMTDAELAQHKEKLSGIIEFVEQLSEVNTDNVEPLSSVVDIELRLREDKVTEGNIVKDILKNAPEELEDFFAVPKVVE